MCSNNYNNYACTIITVGKGGCYYANFDEFSPLSQAEALAMAVDYFRLRTESDYIGRNRLEELATRFKDCINGDEDFENMLDEMDDCEKEFFGIGREEE